MDLQLLFDFLDKLKCCESETFIFNSQMLNISETVKMTDILCVFSRMLYVRMDNGLKG